MMPSDMLVIGGLRNMIDPFSKPIWTIARHMRIRPEAVFQIISDAFDTSIRNGSVIADSDSLYFEADIASFTLTRKGDEKINWHLVYKAKEPMINKEIFPHPKGVFVVPEGMINNVHFPFAVLRELNQVITGVDEVLPEELLDQLIGAYQLAYKMGDVAPGSDVVKFNTSLQDKDGSSIYAVIEPDFYDPIPNTWKLTRVETETGA